MKAFHCTITTFWKIISSSIVLRWFPPSSSSRSSEDKGVAGLNFHCTLCSKVQLHGLILPTEFQCIVTTLSFYVQISTLMMVMFGIKQAFLDVFLQLSPTQVGETLSFSKKIFEFFRKFLEFFWKFLEFIQKNGIFSQNSNFKLWFVKKSLGEFLCKIYQLQDFFEKKISF